MKKIILIFSVLFASQLQSQTVLTKGRLDTIWGTGQVPRGANLTNTWYTLYPNATTNSAPLFFVNAATTTSLSATYSASTLTLTSPLTVVDSYTISIGDSILFKNQTAQLQNGLYVCESSTVFTRCTSYDETAEIYPSQVNVLSGTVNGTKYFLQTTVDPVVGTNNIVYSSIATPAPTTNIYTSNGTFTGAAGSTRTVQMNNMNLTFIGSGRTFRVNQHDIQLNAGSIATSQIKLTTTKLGFYSTTPITKPAAVTTVQGLYTGLSNLGLFTAGTITSFSTNSITATSEAIVPTMSYPSNTTNAASTAYVTTAIAAIPPSVVDNKTLYVSPTGSDADATRAGHLGKITSGFLTLEAAMTAATSGDLIYVFPGTYTVTTTATAGLAKDGVTYYFEPGCTLNKSTAGAMFKLNSFTTGFSVLGYADLNKTGTAASIWECTTDLPFSATLQCQDLTNTTTGACIYYSGASVTSNKYHKFDFRNALCTGGGTTINMWYSSYGDFKFSSIRNTASYAVYAYEQTSYCSFTGTLIESTATYAVGCNWGFKAMFNVQRVNGATYGFDIGGYINKITLNGNTNGITGTPYFTLNGYCQNVNISGGKIVGGFCQNITMSEGEIDTSVGTFNDGNILITISGGRAVLNSGIQNAYAYGFSITGGIVIFNGIMGYDPLSTRTINGATADVTFNAYTFIDTWSGAPPSTCWATLTLGTLRLNGVIKNNIDDNSRPLIKWVGGKLICNGATLIEAASNHVLIQSRTASQTLRVYGGGLTTNAPENSGLLAAKKHKVKFTIATAANTALTVADGAGGSATFSVLVAGFATKALIAQEFVTQINASGAVAILASQDTPGTDEYFYIETDTAGPEFTYPGGAYTNMTLSTILLGSYLMTEVCGGGIIEDADVQ